MADESRTIFVSYASPDRDRVVPYFDRLVASGFTVWMDCKSLKAGQNWDYEIRRALDKAAIIVVFVSGNSVDRRGYVQREVKLALDKAKEKLAQDIYIIPVLLDSDSVIPDHLKDIHCVKAWEKDGFSFIEDSIRHQFGIIGEESRASQARSRIYWTIEARKEAWQGLPGYEVDFSLLRLSSDQFKNISDITDVINGDLIGLIMEERSVKFDQNPGNITFGSDKFMRTNSMDAHCSDPSVQGGIISILFTIHFYRAGAAHSNMFFRTYSFFLDPVVQIKDLSQIFSDKSLALETIRSEVRRQLLDPALSSETRGPCHDADWVAQGTKDWPSFSAFIFKESAIEFYFSPYQVDSYAAGPRFASISYQNIVSLMRRECAEALRIVYLLWQVERAKS